ncbi:MAG: autotransporter outer membrane beta-barrel domain-containing protein [Deltaproteobacteria bacterium]|jgi:hypothetical protein|nr:autotransporter outer membrane beta-barrel domain-containing protein [Deltaproteobacteria bacterium]
MSVITKRFPIKSFYLLSLAIIVAFAIFAQGKSMLFAEVLEYPGAPLTPDHYPDPITGSLFTTSSLKGNNVTVRGNLDSAYGGYFYDNVNNNTNAIVQSNTLKITNGATVNWYAVGGHMSVAIASPNGTADFSTNENMVFVDAGSTIKNSVIGANLTISCQQSPPNTCARATISKNEVRFVDSSITEPTFGELYGGLMLIYGSGTFTISENIVTVVGSTIPIAVFGAESDILAGDADLVVANGNKVILENSSVSADVTGSYVYVEKTGWVNISNNEISSNGYFIGGNIYGGKVWIEVGGTAIIDGSVITLADTQVDGGVIGGYVKIDGTPSGIVLTGAKITLSGDTSLTGSSADCSPCKLAGGYTNVTNIDMFTGNTLNVVNPSSPTGINVNIPVENFEYYNFTFPHDVATGAVALNVTGSATVTLSDGNSKASTIQRIDIDEGNSMPAVGTEVFLVSGKILTTDGSGNDLFTQTSASGTFGDNIGIEWELDYQPDGTYLKAIIRSLSITAKSKSFSEAFMSAAILLNEGADLAVGKGIPVAVMSAYETLGWSVYSVMGFSHSRYETGSHVDTSAYSVQVGLSKGFDVGGSRFTVGAFIEGGRGSYDTYNDYPNSVVVRGNGKSEYLGAGILLRLELPPTGPGNFYVEATARMGRAKNTFSSEDMPNGLNAYDISSDYRGFHLGLGYNFALSEWGRLDLGVRYFQNRRDGTDAVTPSGAPISFGAVESKRLRVGARLSFMATEVVNPYVGAAWEKEFDGEARGSLYNLAIPEVPSLKGNTGIAELGVAFRFPSGVPITLDVGLQGYTGKRKGFGGGVNLNVEF